ncbi:MAG: hypothetical protein LAQ30_29875 [Acidobacteriia bacterium]|nr:hypothetical protein [Terriglobia bacterium]
MQKALATGRIESEQDGRIDSDRADRAWAENTSATQSRPAAGSKPALPGRGEFSCGAAWLALQVCASARRAWPAFVAGLNFSAIPEAERLAHRALLVAVMTYLLQEWLEDYVSAGDLPAIDWSIFGKDGPQIQAETEALWIEWRGPEVQRGLAAKRRA